MFGIRKKDPGSMIEATAIVTEVRDLRAAEDHNSRVRLTLNVQPACGEPWEITKKLTMSAFEIPEVGDPIRVRYFENARDELAVQRLIPAYAAVAGIAVSP